MGAREKRKGGWNAFDQQEWEGVPVRFFGLTVKCGRADALARCRHDLGFRLSSPSLARMDVPPSRRISPCCHSFLALPL